MKGIVITAPGKAEIREMEKPVPGEGEALLRTRYGGICGSDLNSFRGINAYLTYPRIPGHEFSAEIAEIGENEQGFRPGDLVTANPYFNCGKCYSCRRGLVNACMHNETMGVQRDGGFTEYMVMPVSRLIGGGKLDPKTLALIEPFCIGYHGILRASVRPGDRVLIMGSGTIGVMAAISAKTLGAQVWMCDVAPGKLELARAFKPDGTILNDTPGHFRAAWQEITDGNGFDVTVECVGLPETLQACLDAACFGGRVSVIGIGKRRIDLDFTVIQKKELNIYGSRNALSRDFTDLVHLAETRIHGLDRVITNVYPFAEAARAFGDFDRQAGSMLKVMLEF